MLRRFCETHYDALADKSPVLDAGERVVDIKPDPGELCEFCKKPEPALRLARLAPKEGE